MAKNNKEKEEQSSGGKGNNLLIIILGLVVLGVGAFGGFYFFLKNSADKKVEEVTFVVSKETTINLSDSANSNGKKSYLKTGISLSYDKDNSKLAKEIESKKIQLQDTAILYLKTKTAEDFQAGKEEDVKKGLIEEIDKILDHGKIIDVYYSTGEDSANFLVQSA